MRVDTKDCMLYYRYLGANMDSILEKKMGGVSFPLVRHSPIYDYSVSVAPKYY